MQPETEPAAPVLLIHSSAAHPGQWQPLQEAGVPGRRLVAAPMFGYGGAPGWAGPAEMTLADAAAPFVALAGDASRVALVGHSMGASVAMAAAAILGDRVDRLVLVEPNAFFLLTPPSPGWNAAQALARRITQARAVGDWAALAPFFCDYWLGAGAWAAMPAARRAKMVAALPPLGDEAAAVFAETRRPADWAAQLPRKTTVITAADTVAAVHEIAGVLRSACPAWRFALVPAGGHMAPVTRPDLVTPEILRALCAPWPAEAGLGR